MAAEMDTEQMIHDWKVIALRLETQNDLEGPAKQDLENQARLLAEAIGPDRLARAIADLAAETNTPSPDSQEMVLAQRPGIYD